MKVVTPEENKAYNSAVLQGGLFWGVVGTIAATGGSLIAQRRVPTFQSITLPLKAFGVTSVGTFSFVIGSDHASRKFEMAKFMGDTVEGRRLREEAYQGMNLEQQSGLNDEERQKAELRANLSETGKALEWARENRYKVVMGAWAVSLGGSLAYISTTPLSFTQKLVQARMYAQGLTVALLVASAGLATMGSVEYGGKSEEEWKEETREKTMYRMHNNRHHSKTATIPAEEESSK